MRAVSAFGIIAAFVLAPQSLRASVSPEPSRTWIDEKLLSADHGITEARGLIVCRIAVGSLEKRVRSAALRLDRVSRAAEAKQGHNFRIFYEGDILTGDCRYPLKPLPSSARRLATSLLAEAEADIRVVEKELGIVGA